MKYVEVIADAGSSDTVLAKVVFFVKGIRPRAWREKERSKRAMAVYLSAWLVSLVLLVLAIYVRRFVTI